MNQWDDYLGKLRERNERVEHKDLMGLASLLDYETPASIGETSSPWPVDAVPPFAHWLNGNPHARQSALGADGHPERGSFMPDIPYPRRMWAGSRVHLLQDYSEEKILLHRETIQSITNKKGRSGEMVFVTLLHDYLCDSTLVLREEQDIVYRAAAQVSSAESEKHAQSMDEAELLGLYEFDWYRQIQPNPVLLFRYSAITFNGHRIHYDRDYATGVEGYPGLVVHGPLTATLLIDLYQRNNPQRRVKEFAFKSLGPLFDIQPFYIMGKQSASGVDLWAVDCEGHTAMQMTLSAQ